MSAPSQGDSTVEVDGGGDADRATRPGEHLDVGRQELAQAVFEYSDGVPAAELHQARRFSGALMDALQQFFGKLRVAVFLDVFHVDLALLFFPLP
jgi:hypothetical protein